MTVTKKGDYIVTAASDKENQYSEVSVWPIDSSSPVCRVPADGYIVHQIECSPDNRYLLCTASNGGFLVFRRDDRPGEPFSLVQAHEQTRAGALRSCSWAHDSKYFATGSEEKTDSLEFWSQNSEDGQFLEHS